MIYVKLGQSLLKVKDKTKNSFILITNMHSLNTDTFLSYKAGINEEEVMSRIIHAPFFHSLICFTAHDPPRLQSCYSAEAALGGVFIVMPLFCPLKAIKDVRLDALSGL